LQRDFPDSAYIFVSERGGPMTPDAARKTIRKSGEGAKLQFPVHPHMLRRSYPGLFDCGDSLGFPVWSKGRFDDSIDVRTSNDIRLSTIKLVLCRKTT